MYYEEKLIEGVWYWRGTPNGEWTQFSSQKLHAKIASLESIIDSLMLEHCPQEMTANQIQRWAAHQQQADESTG